MPDAFQRVAHGLLSTYAVSFTPQGPKGEGRLNKLRVEMVNPDLLRRGVEIAHPQGVFFGAPPAPRR